MSTSPPSNLKKHSHVSVTSVQINDQEGGETFMCDEEPHMLSPQHGYGYYPITLGQKLADGKLEVVRKLGWGSYSSVWLARTLEDAYPAKYVAVKVLTVDATSGLIKGFFHEEDTLRIIKNKKPDHAGYNHCLHLYGAFHATSPHGSHLCLVTNVMGESITEFRKRQSNHHGAFPLVIVKRIIKQTILALDYLHRECGFMHMDVTPDNVLISLEHEDEAITRLLQGYPSAIYDPRIELDLSPDPIITVMSQPLPNFGLRDDASNLHVCLIDFGTALHAVELKLEQGQPTFLRAPEVILGHPWSTPVDIWSLGCLAFDYLTGAVMFRLWESASMTQDHVHLQKILEHSGPFPSRFLEECDHRSKFFDEQGSLLLVQDLSPSPIEQCLRTYKVLKEEEIVPAAAFIQRCLTIDPRARATALELLDDEWLKDA